MSPFGLWRSEGAARGGGVGPAGDGSCIIDDNESFSQRLGATCRSRMLLSRLPTYHKAVHFYLRGHPGSINDVLNVLALCVDVLA